MENCMVGIYRMLTYFFHKISLLFYGKTLPLWMILPRVMDHTKRKEGAEH